MSPFAKHTLRPHVETPELSSYYLIDPSPGIGLMESCYLVFTPEGIVITGDFCPNNNQGVISWRNYSRAWFCGSLSPDYLCEKFLRKRWQSAKGHGALSQYLREVHEDRHEGDRDNRKILAALTELSRIQPDDLTELDAHDIYDRAGLCDFEDMGQGYDPRDMEILASIQQRFAELYPLLVSESHQPPAAGEQT